MERYLDQHVGDGINEGEGSKTYPESKLGGEVGWVSIEPWSLTCSPAVERGLPKTLKRPWSCRLDPVIASGLISKPSMCRRTRSQADQSSASTGFVIRVEYGALPSAFADGSLRAVTGVGGGSYHSGRDDVGTAMNSIGSSYVPDMVLLGGLLGLKGGRGMPNSA